jgi:hypothetical protein
VPAGTPIDTSTVGARSFGVTATDAAGNQSSTATSYTVTPAQATPVITPTLAGTLGANGWYTSNVVLSWTVTSATRITSQSGCTPHTVSSNTTGSTYTCKATNAGGTTSLSVTIKRDASAPTTRATVKPSANSAGWQRAVVTVTFTGTDSTSGIASCSPPVSLTEGTGQSASGVCTNNAGLLGAPATASNINVDLTPPTVTITTPASGAVYPRNSAVTASFFCSDALSGIAASNGCAGNVTSGTPISTGTRGTKSFTVTGRDAAGNTTGRTVSYTVQ